LFKRGTVGLSSVGVALALAVTAVVTSPPASAASTPGDPGRIFVVTVNDEGISAGILRQAAVDPAYRERALALVERWQSDLQAGKTVSLGAMTDGRSQADGTAAASRLKDQLKALAVTSAASSNTDSTALTVAPMGSGLNPNTFPVVGATGTARPSTYWVMNLAVAGAYCTPSGCGPNSDQISCRATINPGSLTSRVSYNCLYSPSIHR
jgi:hypothetical protein